MRDRRDGGDEPEGEPTSSADEPGFDPASVDREMDSWRQGDVVATEKIPFVTLALAELPLSKAAVEAAEEGPSADHILEVFTEERGLVVLGQTCDIVRSCTERPFIDVAPLVELEADDYREVQRGRSVRYAVVPSLAAERLVADLDRVMTVEKALLAYYRESRLPGCVTDAERRALASSLARRRGRFAFPDDFAEGVGRMVDHIVAKHGKESPLGRFLAGLVDIRALCTDWEAEAPTVIILFVYRTLAETPSDAGQHADALVDRFVPTGKFASKPTARATNLETMSAAAYLESDALELEYVSRRGKPAT